MIVQVAVLLLLLVSVCISSGCGEGVKAESVPRVSIPERQFDKLLKKYLDLTYQQLADQTATRDYVDSLSFDPSTFAYFDEAVKSLKLTEKEQRILRRQGFVSVDHDQRYSFGSLYYAVYSSDLPVLVTTDSILHAMHRTYDDILMEMEQTYLTSALDQLLTMCHDELASDAPRFGAVAKNYRDVDLYLTVARNLLKGAGAPAGAPRHPGMDEWDGSLLITSKLGQDEEATDILQLVQSLVLQRNRPDEGEITYIYSGARPIDYSQFRPRGHYTKTAALKRYFRTMMWLGRADTGWNVLPPDPESGIVSDAPRELRNAVLLTRLIESTGAIEYLRPMYEILDFMVGESDELTVMQMAELMNKQGVTDVGDLVSGRDVTAFQTALLNGELGAQRIRSQVVLSDPRDLYQVPPPSTYQMFGQRFVIDSFVLSKVVYDSIIFEGEKVKRKMPTGLDVMYALGNHTALPLLEKELTEFPYASNLQASQDFVGQYEKEYWRGNLYNIWLDSLRTLDADLSSERNSPESMRTKSWQLKQLQTQLASWAELRHNTVLYAKQSYTAEVTCEYPAGYVEPYPETYARIKYFAEEAARRIEAIEINRIGPGHGDVKDRQVAFFKTMAATVGKLESLARKELAAEPFTPEEQEWLKKVIDIRGGGSGAPTYSGWYCQLFYGGGLRSAEWSPTVIDVHTNPDKKTVLEQGVGNCNFLVVAIDNEDDRMIYVGPAYSYYEFEHPAENRLTDELWTHMLLTENAPDRPIWTRDFQAPKMKRDVGVGRYLGR